MERRPTDYDPVVSAPWEPEGVSVDAVVRRIYLEPMSNIRAGLLADYLERVPVSEFGKVFDLAISLEGFQCPDETAHQILSNWARRDPESAWVKTKELVGLAGIESSWLGYAGWDHGRLHVVSREAIQRAGYRLSPQVLVAFPVALDASDLTGAQRVRLMKEFNELWYRHFDVWPRGFGSWGSSSRGDFSRILEAKGESLQFANSSISGGADGDVAYELIVRRRLVEDVKSARSLVEEMSQRHSGEVNWTGRRPQGAGLPSSAFLLLWARADKDDLVRWSDEVAAAHPDTAWLAKCILMSFVDATTRETWLRSIVGTEHFEARLELLSQWEPELAMQLAIKSAEPHFIGEVLLSAAYGPWDQMCFDTCHFGIAYVREFDLSRIPEGQHGEALGESCTAIMEQWQDIDCGESARFGMKIVFLVGEVTRADLLKTLRGEIMSADNDGVWDRTFCSLRGWAIMQPTAMREWIEKQPEPVLREALTWLLEHPWGKDP